MIDFIPLGGIPFYAVAWRFIFRKIAYYYVVKPRRVDNNTQIQIFEPQWDDIGYAIVGATVGAFFWPLIGIWAICSYVMARTQPTVVAERLGGKMPKEARMALLELKTKELEMEVGMHHTQNPLRGEVV